MTFICRMSLCPVNFHSGVEKGESKPLDFEATFVMRLLWVRR